MGLQEDFDRLQAGEGHAQVGRVPGLGGVAPEIKLMGKRRGIAAALKGLGRSLGRFWDQEGLGTFNSRKVTPGIRLGVQILLPIPIFCQDSLPQSDHGKRSGRTGSS